jgi:AcrR family transcriptional regulator
MARKGRPPHQPTDKDRRAVTALCAAGVREDDIARVLGVSGKTLRKHYRRELDIAVAMATLAVATRLWDFIEGRVGGPREQLTAAIFWLKTRAGWRETHRHEHGGARDAPPAPKIKMIALSEDECGVIRSIAERRALEGSQLKLAAPGSSPCAA